MRNNINHICHFIKNNSSNDIDTQIILNGILKEISNTDNDKAIAILDRLLETKKYEHSQYYITLNAESTNIIKKAKEMLS